MDNKIENPYNLPSEFIMEQTPYDIVPLPSEGKLYKNKKDTIKLGLLTAADENILTSPNIIQSGKMLDILLERKILDKDIKHTDLLSGDRNALLVFLRVSGYGEKYPLIFIDPKTDQEFEFEVDLSKLPIKNLGATPDEKMEFSFTLPFSKDNVKFKLLTAGDEMEAKKEAEGYQGPIKPVVTKRLEKQIMEINGNRDKGEIYRYIQTMKIGDSGELRKYINKIEPGISMFTEVEAPSGEKFRSSVSIGVNFFWPYLEL